MRNLVQKQLFLLGVVLVFCASLPAKTLFNGTYSLESAVLVLCDVRNFAMFQAYKKMEQYLQQNNLGTPFNFQQVEIESKLIVQFVENNFVFLTFFQGDSSNGQSTLDRKQNNYSCLLCSVWFCEPI